MTVNVIGAGLAGCEAALQLAKYGVSVRLYEMKPKKFSPAHKSADFAELVCSNSLKADRIENACGLLKEEMRLFGSVMMEAADVSRVPAGGALAVDRDIFSRYITDKVRECPLIEVVQDEVTKINPDEYTIIATGPLTSDALSAEIAAMTGAEHMYFYDAAAPVLTESSIDKDKVFFAARYGKGTADYINCPMTKAEYDAFYTELINAETAPLKEFEDKKVFEGCMPVEVMAQRGEETLRFGPMKPVGIHNPETGESYYAVVQLRRENEEGTMFNLVGFQTHLTFPEQRRVFRMIPGLENAEFLRYGVMHRNTFLNSPELLCADYSMRDNRNLFFAGQMTGVEGYIESAASGYAAGMSAAARAEGREPFVFPDTTMIGAMSHYVSEGGVGDFQPMNANFGIIAHTGEKIKGGKKIRYQFYADRALSVINSIIAEKDL